jgi:glycosyltransferase involved in cell wall biosynthesis
MHVLHVSNSLVAGGSELHLLALCRHLGALGVTQTVAYLHERPVSRTLKDNFEAIGVPAIPAHAEGRYNVTFPLAVSSIVARIGPDILHTHLPRADLAGAFVTLRARSLPWVISMHNIYGAHSWSGAALLPVLDVVWRRADLIIAVSGAVAEWLIGRGIDPGRVRMIHYGIDDEAFAPPPGDPKARWGWSGRPVVTAIGRLTPHKGFATLISAWQVVHAQMPDAVLAIAGWDVQGYRQVLEAQIDALGLQDAVRLMGFLDDVPAFLAAGDVFAHPTTSEGFGQVMIEAMAAARPIVCSRIPPLMEIVVDGETGVFVPPGDAEALGAALLRMLTDPEAPAMGARGRARVRAHYSAARMAERTLDVYSEVLGLRSPAPVRAAGGS